MSTRATHSEQPVRSRSPSRAALELVNLAAATAAPTIEHVGIFQQIVDGLPEQAALVDAETGLILVINESWDETVRRAGYGGFAPGNNYIVELAKLAAENHGAAAEVLHAVEEMRHGKRTVYRLVYEGIDQQAGQTFEVRIGVIHVSGHRYIRITRYDVTELALLRSIRDDFSASLAEAQERERRRMGRELHDSGLQLLCSLSLGLATLKRAALGSDAEVMADQLEDLLHEAQREFRSISFLAHPPQVERLGLVEAVRAIVEGFGQRAVLKTNFLVEGQPREISAEASRAMFRVVQEALSNVHRHAGARKLLVRLVWRKRALHVLVGDDGRGIPENLRHGVGLLGMRDRMTELGGRLALTKASPGAMLHACLPIRAVGVVGPGANPVLN